MRRICFVLISVLFTLSFLLASSHAQWAATYFGQDFKSVQNTPDGGFIISRGSAGSVSVLKTDSNGIPIWNKYYYNSQSGIYHSSGLGFSYARSGLQLTTDGGFILITFIHQQPDGTYGAGGTDIWLLKLADDGEIEWQRTYGGPENETPSGLRQTTDGGYIITGRTVSFNQDGLWILKLDSQGTIEWQKVYGGYTATSIDQTNDGGYILTGWTSSDGAGGDDIWVLKVDANGEPIADLQKTFGGAHDDTGYVIKQTTDNGYILGGQTRSFNVHPGTAACMWILKLDDSLNVEWQNTYGGTSLLPDSLNVDRTKSFDILQSSDGDFIIAGMTSHFGQGAHEAWLLKVDASNQGAIMWEKTFGGYEASCSPLCRFEGFLSVIEASDGSITAAGKTQMTFGELGFLVNTNSSGEIPGCNIMGDSTAIVTATGVTGQATQAVSDITSATVLLPPGVARTQDARLREFICPEGYDLSIRLEDRPDPIRPNHYVAYVLTAENLGSGENTNVSVDAVLPAELTYFSSTSTQGTALETGGTVTFDIGTLAAGESATLSVIARAGSVGTHAVTAEITSDEIAFDNIVENNTTSETTSVSNMLNVTVDEMDWEKFDMAVDSRGYAHFVYTEDYELRYATNASGEWLRWTLADGDDVKNPAMALDSSDKVHIIFAQGPDFEDNALKYMHNLNGAWSTPEIVMESAGSAWSTDLAVGSDDSVHLCYLNLGPADPQASLIYMTTQGQDPGEWSGRGIHPAGYDAAALALDSNNHVHIIFYSFQVIQDVPGTGGVGYRTNAPDGGWQEVEMVDMDWRGCSMEGMRLDIAVDSANIPHIIYSGDADTGDGEDREDTRYANKPSGAWLLDKVDDGVCSSKGKSISLDSDGNPHVSYTYDATPNDLWDPIRLRTADNKSGNWNHTTIATVSIDSKFNAIAVDRWDQVHLGYFEGDYTGGDLKYAVIQSLPDSDGDGVGDAEEAEAPNSGDGNEDGIQDSEQSHVVSLETVDNANMVTLVAPVDTALTQVRSIFNPSLDDMPNNADFPFGFFEFTLLGSDIGSTTTVDFLLPDATTNSYFKYGSTPLLPTDHWHLFDWDDKTGAQASGSTITLNLLDGKRGDHDLTANGIISDPGGPAVGPAGLQHIRLSLPILEFGELMVGESTQLDLTVMNVGESNLSIDSITPPDAPFSISVENCSGEVLVPDGSCLVTVSFEPAALGDARGILLVLSDDPSFPSLGVTLLGTGMPRPEPEIQVMPTSLEFGDVDMGSSSDLSISVTNVGGETLHVDDVPALAPPFSIIDDQVSNAVIHTGDSVELTVRFEPSSSGFVNTSLQIPSDDPDNNPLWVPVSGTGVGNPVPDIALSRTSIDFGDVITGTTANQSFTIENTGDADLIIGTITGLESPYSLQIDACSGSTLNSGASCTVAILFEPDAAGSFSDSLSIPSNDPDENPASIDIFGDGVDPDTPILSISPDALDFGEQTTQLTVSIGNTGTGTLSWTISPALPDWLTVDPMSGDTTSTPTDVTVTVDRSQAQGSGNHTFSILVDSNGGDGNVAVAMTKLNLSDPVAEASFEPDNAPAGDPVQLNGSDSYDPDGDSLTYQWAWEFDPDTETFPPAFGAHISDYRSANPIMTSPYAGEYRLSLTVSDGTRESEKAFITITLVENPEENNQPIADSGGDQSVVVDNPLTLDGTASSDPDGDPIIRYAWRFVWDEENGTAPIALGATLTDFDTAHPVFTCTRPGQFLLFLVVTDSRGDESEPDLFTITVQDASLNHSDTDGIPDADELGPDGATADFDGNGDQIPDNDQNNVASTWTQSGDDYLTIASESDTFLSDVEMVDGLSGGSLPDGFTFQQQFFAFTVNNVDLGGTTTVTIYLPDGVSADTYWKYGPTLDNANPHWYEFMWDGTTGARINGNVITLTFVDGQRGDDVLIPDGKVIDLGGPGVTTADDGDDDDDSGGDAGCFINTLQ